MSLFWTLTGEKYSNGKKDRISRAINQMEWMNLGTTRSAKSLPEIKASILKFDISVTRIAISDALAPLKLYGIEAQYENAFARVYLVEDCTTQIMIAFTIEQKSQDS